MEIEGIEEGYGSPALPVKSFLDNVETEISDFWGI